MRKWPKMKLLAAVATTSSGIQSTPTLKEVVFDNLEKIPLQGMDLNQFVQIHFKAEVILFYTLLCNWEILHFRYASDFIPTTGHRISFEGG